MKMGDGKHNVALSLETENYTKKIKRELDNWREICLILNSILLWKNNYYASLIFAITSLIFLQFVYYDPTFLTLISLILLVITVVDYFGPTVSAAIWKQENWSSGKERELEEICRSLATFTVNSKYKIYGFLEMKKARPNMYFPVAMVSLFLLAWIGNSINNLLLTYIIVLFVLFMPGLIHHGIAQKYYEMTLLSFANVLHKVSGQPTK